MKRTSLLSCAIILIVSLSAKAYDDSYYIPLNYRTHWSPYTQSMINGPVRYDPRNLRYGRSGLVSDYLNYLPYNMSYDKNSLVCDDLHYAPYALAYDSDNLIDYWTRYLPYDLSFNNPCLFDVASSGYCYGNYNSGAVINVLINGTQGNSCPENYQVQSFSQYAKKGNAAKYADRKALIEAQKARLEKISQEKANDPSVTISQILKSYKISFRTSRYLEIDEKTVSVNFDIEDANIIIKFWNSREINELEKNDDYKKKAYENYVQSWENYYLNYIGSTKKVYNIFAGSKEEIFEQLCFYDDSKNEDALYVLAQNQP